MNSVARPRGWPKKLRSARAASWLASSFPIGCIVGKVSVYGCGGRSQLPGRGAGPYGFRPPASPRLAVALLLLIALSAPAADPALVVTGVIGKDGTDMPAFSLTLDDLA